MGTQSNNVGTPSNDVGTQNTGREAFSNRLGFILISAGCAIGLGNIWRFPYIVGEYGGAAFVVIYLIFLVILGVPIMAMEFAVGRASQKSAAKSFNVLQPEGTKWHWFKWVCIGANYLLMMFFTVVSGWMIAYVFKMAFGKFNGLSPEAIGGVFNDFLASPLEVIGWTFLVVIAGFFVCSLGLQEGVEKVTKVMMAGLCIILLILCIKSMTLKGGAEGLKFYLIPDFAKMFEGGVTGLGNAMYAAMGQAFFTLSIGISSMAIFGSYIGKERRLTGEAWNISVLDTVTALMAGLIIFPACFAFGVEPDSGPGLVMVTLPNIFNQMVGGQIWGTLFFIFMTFAAMATVIAVFENIIGFSMDQWGWSRKKTSLTSGIILAVLTIPCALGFNLWSDFNVPGIGGILDLEDFIISNNILPLGSLVYVLFCVNRYGWGWKNFLLEVNTGEKGMRFPVKSYIWIKYGIPILVVIILIVGYIPKFQQWFGG